MEKNINSKEYWDKRFQSSDWEENLGRKQSRFFGQLALENFPQWLKDQIVSNRLTVCDWGCALGDGTDVLASIFGKKQVSGVDFSREAVVKAETHYPDLKFYASDWIEGDSESVFDIVFSSNTLEHFSDSVYVLDRLFQYAKKALILLLPFRELERISEHFSSFFPESVYISPVPQSHLLFAKIIETTRCEPSYWHGEQILLVYGRSEWINELKLNLDMIQIDIKTQQVHQKNTDLIDKLNDKLKEYTRENALLTNSIIESNNQIKSLTADLLEESHNAQSLQIQIIEGKNQIQRLSDKLQEKSAAIDQFKLQLSNYEQIVQETKENLTNREQAFKVLAGKLSVQEQASKTLEEKLGEQKQVAKSFEEKLIEQEQVAKTLEEKLIAQEQVAKAFEEKLIEQGQVAKTFEEKLIEQGQVAKTFEEKLIEQGQVAKTFEEKLIEQEQVAKELSAEIAKEQELIQLYEQELSSIKTSRGWKLLWFMWQVRLFFVPNNSWLESLLLKKKPWVIRKYLNKVFRSREKAFRFSSPLSQSTEELVRGILLQIRERAYQGVFIVTSAFVFDELYNQRVINLSKFLSNKRIAVIYVAWRWSKKEPMLIGEEVYRNVFQVPVDIFLDTVDLFSEFLKSQEKYFLVEFPHPDFFLPAISLKSHNFKLVYDIIDEWEEFHKVDQAAWFDRDIEKSFVINADFVVASAPSLKKKFAGERKNIFLLPNGYSPSLLGQKRGTVDKKKYKKDILEIGYFGHLTSSWVDWDFLLSILALASSQNIKIKAHIIGYGEPNLAIRMKKYAGQILLHGKVRPSDLYKYVEKWDAAFIFFKKSKLSESVDPIKIYEYIYFGLPVLVKGIDALENTPFTDIVDNEQQVIDILRSIQRHGLKRYEKDIARRNDFLTESVWDKRFENLLALLESKL